MELKEIYQPIRKELVEVERILESYLYESKNQSILKINRFLLESPGKRIRPALVILSAKASCSQHSMALRHNLIKIASAIELIHMASLIHDDVVDHSYLRHNKPTVNSKWGQDVSIALGDYLYSLAFKLISKCGNADILDCVSSAAKAMCSGELIQIVERDNVSLLKERYLLIIKKKTAALFAASCQSGALLAKSPRFIQSALKRYGLNFGIAFQIIDDYLDLTATTEELGKPSGLDLTMGELTLPFLLLSESRRKRLLSIKNTRRDLNLIKEALDKSGALLETRQIIDNYITKAKEWLGACYDSEYKDGLLNLADFINKRL